MVSESENQGWIHLGVPGSQEPFLDEFSTMLQIYVVHRTSSTFEFTSLGYFTFRLNRRLDELASIKSMLQKYCDDSFTDESLP